MELRLEVAEPSDAAPAVVGSTDVAVVVDLGRDGPAQRDGLTWVHLLDDPYHIVLPRGYDLARCRALRLEDIADEPWLQTASVPGPCQDVVLGARERAGFRPRVAVEGDDYPTTQGLVAAGVGVALVPDLALGAVRPGVVVRPIKEHRPVRHIHAVLRDVRTPHPTVRAFLDALLMAARTHRDGTRAQATGISRDLAGGM